MRRFIIFFSSGLVVIAAVFIYAQYGQKTVLINWNSKPNTTATIGEVKGSKDTVSPKNSAAPIQVQIDKNPVLLYYPQKITIQTSPEIEVRVKVTYPNGSVNNSGTQSGISAKDGKFIVKWNIKGNVKDMLGTASVDVAVGSLDNYSQSHQEFEIVKTL